MSCFDPLDLKKHLKLFMLLGRVELAIHYTSKMCIPMLS